MPEILTESFCERCGTRYTFESAAPKQKRLGRFKVLSQGFKNFVMSDDTSLDEAFAAARNDEEREAVSQQLDAFHKTFNFCMNCRQYTCSNCWNEAEGRCLTCAPHLGHDVLQAPFPALGSNGNGVPVEDAPRLDAMAWPTLDLPAESTAAADLAWPEAPEAGTAQTVDAAHAERPASTAREDGLPDWASIMGESSEAQVADGPPAEPEDLETLLAHTSAPADVPEVVADAAEPAVVELEEEETAAEVVEPVEPVEAEAVETQSEAVEAETAVNEPTVVDERVAAATAQTSDLLARFRPGQSIDAALEEYEAALAAQDLELETALPEAAEEPVEPLVAAAESDVAEALEAEGVEPAAETPAAETPAVEPVAAAATPLEVEEAPLDEVLAEEPPLEAEIAAALTEAAPVEAQPVPPAAAPEPGEAEIEPVEAEPEPVAATAEPVAEPTAAAEPTPAAAADDRVEVPVWRIVAPDTPAQVGNGRPAETSLPTAASADPQWPQTPAWPGQEAQVDVSFLAARLSRKPANDALWAASSRDVLAPLPQQPAPPAVQTCVTCGLSLSATARFCRRCGSRQEG